MQKFHTNHFWSKISETGRCKMFVAVDQLDSCRKQLYAEAKEEGVGLSIKVVPHSPWQSTLYINLRRFS